MEMQLVNEVIGGGTFHRHVRAAPERTRRVTAVFGLPEAIA
jgi:hypothetical protein